MTDFKPTSQYGQDEFAYRILGDRRDGTFLDIGSGWAYRDSNTASLEWIGWDGVCLDSGKDGTYNEWEWSTRKSQLLRKDALDLELWDIRWRGVINYLSLDVDESSLEALKVLMTEVGGYITFAVITIEHDQYRFGNDIRDGQREILSRAGYELLCPSVFPSEHWRGIVWEDWWVMPHLVAPELKESVRGMNDASRILEALRKKSDEIACAACDPC